MMKKPFLIYQAKSFYNAFIALEQLKAPDEELLFVVPSLVNGAFAVELTIKAILNEQGISYEHEHNLKILFEKLPEDIQNRVWSFLVTKFPEYSDVAMCENELLIMSEAFVKWRYCFEANAPAFDLRFLSAFANAMIFVMFDLGYNTFYVSSSIPFGSEKYAEVDKVFEDNRIAHAKMNQEKIQKKQRREQC